MEFKKKEIKIMGIFLVFLLLFNVCYAYNRTENAVKERIDVLSVYQNSGLRIWEEEIKFEKKMEEKAGEEIEIIDKAILDCLKTMCIETPAVKTEYQKDIEEYLRQKIEMFKKYRERIEWNGEEALFLGFERKRIPLHSISYLNFAVENGEIEYSKNNFYLKWKDNKIGISNRFLINNKKLYFLFGDKKYAVNLNFSSEIEKHLKNAIFKRIEVNEKGAYLVFEIKRKFSLFFIFKIDVWTIFKVNLENHKTKEMHTPLLAYLGSPLD